MGTRCRKRHGVTADDVADALAAIPHLTRAELLDRWQAAYGRHAPKGISRRLLEYAVGNQVQAEAHGGVCPAARRKLTQYGLETPAPPSKSKPARPKAVAPGTRLIRAWQGRTHIVDVQTDGVLYNGRCYRSLSEVARVITGARWSGPRFFGL